MEDVKEEKPLTKKQENKLKLAKIVATRIREVREELGLDQGQAANKCGMSRMSYSHYESGRRLPSFVTLYKLSRGLPISADYLLFGIKKPDI